MKACVVGGGPSGIFLSRYLNSHGVGVNLFEKTNSLLGNYKYARCKTDLTTNLKANVRLNSDESTIDDAECDFYVVATGGKPKELEIDGKEHVIGAMDAIMKYYGASDGVGDTKLDRLLNTPDQSLCIVGMGNVALDLAYYLRNKARTITILNRTGLSKAPFDNYVMRDVVRAFNVNVLGDNTGDAPDRKTKRKLEVLQQKKSLVGVILGCLHRLVYGKPKSQLNLIFNASPQKVTPKEAQLEMSYSIGKVPRTELFDAVISSIGFVPNPVEIKTSKPVYYSGWCVRPRGSIGDAMIDAKNTVSTIMKDLVQ